MVTRVKLTCIHIKTAILDFIANPNFSFLKLKPLTRALLLLIKQQNLLKPLIILRALEIRVRGLWLPRLQSEWVETRETQILKHVTLFKLPKYW